MSARRWLPILAALLGLLAVFVLRAGEKPGGAGGQEGDERERRNATPHEAAPELQSAATQAATAPAAARPSDATAAEPSEARPEGATPPAAPSSTGRGRIRGRANLPTDARPETWVVVWQRRGGSEVVGAGRVLADGAFELDVPSPRDTYALSLRPAHGLWPRDLSGPFATSFQGDRQDVVLEPPTLEAFKIRLRDSSIPLEEIPIQVISTGHYLEVIPPLKLTLPKGEFDLEVSGLQESVLYTVYVGPTTDGRYGSWQGRPKPNESIELALLRGERIHGRVETADGRPLPGMQVLLRSLQGAELTAETASDGTFEKRGLQPSVLWRVEARAKDAAPGSPAGPAQTVPAGSDVVLRLAPARR